MFDSTKGSARERLNIDEAELLKRRGSLILDERRTRPQYFDGRFLTARDLTREQNYFLSRQADLGQASGGGVVHGLIVEEGPTSSSIVIQPGHGVTAAGDLVLLQEPLTVNIANLAEIQQLGVAFGLSQLPNQPLQTRTGLFIVTLRPVEFTDNPIASYPTSITGPRTVEDGDIVEAVAVTLIPYVDRSGNADVNQRRAAAAREIFVEQVRRGAPENALPLAMIAMDLGVVRWVDPYLARREVGALQTSFFGLGQAPRALREAHLIQYQRHLREVLEERGENARITATEHFRALPPAGPMPIGSVGADDFTQYFFPIEVDVSLTVIPSDELAALVEESLTLPPIDLTLSGEDLESTSVLALLPVERRDWQAIRASLTQIERQLKPAVPGLVALRKPIQALQLLRPGALAPIVNPGNIVDQNWRNAFARVVTLLGGFRTLWYARRRNTQITPQPNAATKVFAVLGDDIAIERELTDRMESLGLQTALTRLKSRSTAEAGAAMVALLSSPKIQQSKVLTMSAIEEFESESALNQSAALKVATRFDEPNFGEGIRRLEEALPSLKEDSTLIKRVAGSGLAPELDQLARLLSDEKLRILAEQIGEAGKARDSRKLNNLLASKIKESPV
jgi:hypothetical protein